MHVVLLSLLIPIRLEGYTPTSSGDKSQAGVVAYDDLFVYAL